MSEGIIKDIINPISLSTVKEINGLWYANLEIAKNDYISRESYVEFNGELYIAKKIQKIIDKNSVHFKVKLLHNMVELNNKSIGPFTYTGETPTEMLTNILSGTRWAVGTVNIALTGTVKNTKRITCLAALMLVVRQFNAEIYFNCTKGTNGSWTRSVDLKTEIGEATKKATIRYDKNADYIDRLEDTSKLCTRLYIYGKDNITIASVNGGLDYLDSAHISDYPEPIEVPIYTQIDDKARLLSYAQIYLAFYEHTLYSYTMNILDKSMLPLWSAETFDIGDKIRIYNSDLDLNVDCRISRITKDLAKGKMVVELENLEDRITDFLALLDYYVDKPYDANPLIPPELPPTYDDPDAIDDPIQIPMSGMYLIKANTLTDGQSLKFVARKKTAVDSLGQFWVVYSRSDGAHTQVYCSRSENGQAWAEEVLTVSNMGGGYYDYINFSYPSICIDSNDVAYVSYLATSGSYFSEVQLVVFDGDWGQQISVQGEGVFNPWWESAAVAVDGNDVLHLLLTNFYAGGYHEHRSSTDKGASFTDPVRVYDDEILNIDSQVAFEISPDNTLHIAFVVIVHNPGANSVVRYMKSVDGGATWSASVALNHDAALLTSADTVSIAADSQSSIHAVWTEGIPRKLFYSKYVGGVWMHPVALSTGAAEGGTVSVDDDDKVYVIWRGLVLQPGTQSTYWRQLKFRIFSGASWSTEVTQTEGYSNKRYPTLIQAQFPVANGLRYNISRDGFIVIFTINNDIWVWFNSNWHI